MKTKSFIIITVLTGFLSSQVLAQVDTTNKKSKSDTSWNKQRKDTSGNKRDTAWKNRKDTNDINLNSYYRQNEQSTSLVKQTDNKRQQPIVINYINVDLIANGLTRKDKSWWKPFAGI